MCALPLPLRPACCRVNDLDKLQGLRKVAEDKAFQARWKAVKQEKKKKLAALIKSMYGDDVPLNALYDIHVRARACGAGVHERGDCMHSCMRMQGCARVGLLLQRG